MQNSLFDSFDSVSGEEWKNKVIKDLKGKDFDQTLVINDEIEGITYDPLFHKDDKIVANNFPLNQESAQNSFQNIVAIDCRKEDVNKDILYSLMNGADGIWFQNMDFTEFNTITKEILFDCITSVFEVKNLEEAITLKKKLIEFKDNSIIRIICPSKEEILSEFHGFTQLKFVINGLAQHNTGVNITQEIAFTCAQGLEFIYILNKIKSNQRVSFLIGTGSNYFYEIAKYRAIRSLWSSISKHAQLKHNSIEIHGCTGRVNIAMADHYTNLLRQTTQCMSACLGGANLVSVEPYDMISSTNDSKTLRSSKNIPIILKEEGYLDKIIDPANGSYYIEWLTNEWISKSLDLFKSIEKQGGFNACQQNGFVQNETKITTDKRIQLFKEDKIERIGVNLFQNDQIEPLEKIETSDFTYESTLA